MSKRNTKLGVGIIFAILATVLLFNIQINNNSMFNKTKNFSGLSKQERREQRKKDYLAMKKWQFNRLKDPKTNSIPENIRAKELAFAKELPTAKMQYLLKGNNISNATWVSEGPKNQGGRTKAVVADISNENILLAAAAEGGIWRSTDKGTSWLSVTDPSFIQNSTCLAQDTRIAKTNTWYYGTGEYASNLWPGRNGLGGLLGNGLFKSVDNGLTWNSIESTKSNSPGNTIDKFQIVWNIDINELNTSEDEIWVAGIGGVYGSKDGGETWPLSKNGSGDIIPLYTSVSVTANGRVYAALSSGNNSGIYYSDDGLNWETITPTFWPAEVKRIVIASANSNPNILYVLANTPGVGAPATDEGEEFYTSLWKYDVSGNQWANLSDNLPNCSGENAGYSSQGGYDMCINVKPDDENFVIIGGTNIYRTTDGFSTKLDSDDWIGGYALSNDNSNYENHHADQHGFFFLASNPNVVYSSHDGGISKSNNITAQNVTWSSLNDGYITSQFWSVAINHVTANNQFIVGGLQDNGSMADENSNVQSNWQTIGSGDGMVAAMPDDFPWVYYSAQNGMIFRINAETGEEIGVTPADANGFSFKTPYILDANNTDMMFLGATDQVWYNSNLTEIPGTDDYKTTVNWKVFDEVVDNNNVTALATTKAVANLLYIGDDGGGVYKIVDASNMSSSFVNISGSEFAESNVSSIATDPNNGENVLVAFSSYNVLSLFSTTDGGTTWSCVGGNLENYPDGIGNSPSIRDVKILPVDGGYIYLAATSIGLYSTSTLDGENTIWSLEAPDQMGNIVVETIDVRPIDGRVVIGTFGKGVFSTNYLTTSVDDELTQPTEFSLSQNYPNPFNPSTTIKFNIAKSSNVKLEVFNSLGEKVSTLLNGQKAAGEHSVRFNGSNLASGLYIYKITSANFSDSRKMILQK